MDNNTTVNNCSTSIRNLNDLHLIFGEAVSQIKAIQEVTGVKSFAQNEIVTAVAGSLHAAKRGLREDFNFAKYFPEPTMCDSISHYGAILTLAPKLAPIIFEAFPLGQYSNDLAKSFLTLISDTEVRRHIVDTASDHFAQVAVNHEINTKHDDLIDLVFDKQFESTDSWEEKLDNFLNILEQPILAMHAEEE